MFEDAELGAPEAGIERGGAQASNGVTPVTHRRVVSVDQLPWAYPPEQPLLDAGPSRAGAGQPEVVPQIGSHAITGSARRQEGPDCFQERSWSLDVLDDVDANGDVEALIGRRSEVFDESLVTFVEPWTSEHASVRVNSDHTTGPAAKSGGKVIEVAAPSNVEDRDGSRMVGPDPFEQLVELRRS
jgi:hypothetical protein